MIMYAVTNKNHLRSMSVLLMGTCRKSAINLWEHWNDGLKFSKLNKKEGWVLKKYTVTLR